ncbi:MAG: hypothetical protein L0Y55_20795, partial [Anaerolineales bacterium]|nr:hypothetical protein [Anaerolineales bacterium]
RQWFGWILILGSDLAFGAVTVFSMKRLFVSEAAQQPIVNLTMLLADVGLASVLVILAIFLVWRLADLAQQKGFWSRELATERRQNARLELEEQQRKAAELAALLKEGAE